MTLNPFNNTLADDYEQMQESGNGNGNGPKKRGRTPAEAAAPTPLVLTVEQVQKIWNKITGGRLVFELDMATNPPTPICYASRDSFDLLLSDMINRL